MVAAMLGWNGFVDQPFLSRLSKLCKAILMPCLIFDSVASNLSLPFIMSNWTLVIAGALVVPIGGVVGTVLAWLVSIPSELKPWFVISVALPNSVALPLLLLEAVCHDQVGDQAGVAACIHDTTARLFTIALVHPAITWLLCPMYIRFMGTERNMLVEQLIDVEDVGQKASFAASVCSTFRRFVGSVLENPPVFAHCCALVVGAVPFLRGLFYGSSAPLSFVASGISTLARCSVGITTILTGSILGLQLKGSTRENLFGFKDSGISASSIVWLIVCRVALVPGVIVSLIFAFSDWVPRDGMSRLILCLIPAGVTANAVTILAQVLEQPHGAHLLAVASAPQLLAYTLSATAFVAIGMAWNVQQQLDFVQS
eukprot:TRINITY_DN67508_c0_g1_i1.p1 TRINITY_DN67508_c0_g1~~TRINITY_DN67508_c0_g1_i1.p1  ORF type:complete len:412 (+),score=45.83 TRINITY_DN67508_c0_g1_i1:129-1238(+)